MWFLSAIVCELNMCGFPPPPLFDAINRSALRDCEKHSRDGKLRFSSVFFFCLPQRYRACWRRPQPCRNSSKCTAGHRWTTRSPATSTGTTHWNAASSCPKTICRSASSCTRTSCSSRCRDGTTVTCVFFGPESPGVTGIAPVFQRYDPTKLLTGRFLSPFKKNVLDVPFLSLCFLGYAENRLAI